MARKKTERTVEETDELVKDFDDVVISETSEVSAVQKKMEKVDNAMKQELSDLDGIGDVRLKKLYSNGIYTIDDLLTHGEESLAKMLEISWEDARKMTMKAIESLNTDEVFSNMIVSGKEYFDYRKNKIFYLTTGLPEFDDITGGYESGVITEFFGAFGAGKTQLCELACIMAQLPSYACCLECGEKTEEKTCPKCQSDRHWNGGGLSEWGKPCRIVYVDTENSYRAERVFSIVCNRGLIKTKPQSKTDEKRGLDKEPLNDEEFQKAMEFVYNIDISRPRTSAIQMLIGANLSAMIDGDLCKVCHKRQINKEGLPTHQNHPKAKEDMVLEKHDFEQDRPAKLVIIDSIISKFRKEYEGRGTLSDRQMKLKTHVKMVEATVETKNVVCLVTNQVGEKMDVMGDNIRPVGGNEIGHTFTTRIYLKKAQSLTNNKITAILVDSPNKAKNEVIFELGREGIQKLTA